MQKRVHDKNQNTQGELKYTKTVQCNVCGVRVPQEEALSHQGHYYCGNKHLEQDTSNSD